MFLDHCRHVCIGGYGIYIGYGDGSANRFWSTRLVGLLGEIAVGPCYRDGIFLAEVSLDTFFEIVTLNENLGVLAGIDAVGGCGGTEVIVQHVDLADTNHRHSLYTAWSPPVEGEGGVQEACRLAVAIANEISVLVHIRAFGIAEGTPADGVKVRTLGDVEVAVHTVREGTVVNPAVLGTIEGKQVASTYIDRAGAYEGDITNDDVLLGNSEYSRFAVALSIVARKPDDNLSGVEFRLFYDTLSVG